MPKIMIKLYTCDETGALGFAFDGTFITRPFLSECGRFSVNPQKYYGLSSAQIRELECAEIEAEAENSWRPCHA